VFESQSKTQACGLAEQYRQDDNIKILVRRAAVLSLVPVNEVEYMWCHALEYNDNDTPGVNKASVGCCLLRRLKFEIDKNKLFV
jgi:hypothetical protein